MVILPLFLMIIFSVIMNAAQQQEAPSTPIIDGPCEAKLEVVCNYTVWSIDPQGDDLYYTVRYSDDPTAIINIGPFASGVNITISHCWCDEYQTTNPFYLKVKAIDEQGHESDWARFNTNITNNKPRFKEIFSLKSQVIGLFEWIFTRLLI
jgi:hypothetical protein